jgi:hypothetical protein
MAKRRRIEAGAGAKGPSNWQRFRLHPVAVSRYNCEKKSADCLLFEAGTMITALTIAALVLLAGVAILTLVSVTLFTICVARVKYYELSKTPRFSKVLPFAKSPPDCERTRRAA